MWPSFSFKITSCIFAVINSKFLPLFHTQHHHLHEGKIPSHCLYYETHHWSSVKIINNKGLTLLHILLNTSFLSSVEKLLSPCVQYSCPVIPVIFPTLIINPLSTSSHICFIIIIKHCYNTFCVHLGFSHFNTSNCIYDTVACLQTARQSHQTGS